MSRLSSPAAASESASVWFASAVAARCKCRSALADFAAGDVAQPMRSEVTPIAIAHPSWRLISRIPIWSAITFPCTAKPRIQYIPIGSEMGTISKRRDPLLGRSHERRLFGCNFDPSNVSKWPVRDLQRLECSIVLRCGTVAFLRPVADLSEDRLRPFEAGKADTQVSVR